MNILPYKNILPTIETNVFVASTAVIIGDIEIGEKSGIWFNCVLRGDVEKIIIGKNTNIQDNTVIHCTRPNHLLNKAGKSGGKTIIGDNVTIGHGCIIHACEINSNCFIGMGSLLMDGSCVEEYSMIAAGSLLTPGKTVKKFQLWGGRPANYMRDLTEEEISYILVSANNYSLLAEEYKS